MKQNINNEEILNEENAGRAENGIKHETGTEEKAEESKAENTQPENQEPERSDTEVTKDGRDGKNKELDELNDRYVRLYAEYDNYRKRSEKEKGESFQAGVISAVSMFVPLLDNLDRALAFEPENEGLKLLCKQVRDIFEKLGVETIDPDGQPFDPQLHNAVMHEEDPEKGENIVSQTFQKGYTLNGKIIRHAIVKVVN